SVGILRTLAGEEIRMRGLEPIILGVGLLILVIALGAFWTSRDPSPSSLSTKPIGASTLSHGGPMPAPPGLAPTDQSPSLWASPQGRDPR
ncbi:MAG TPA: hypothetical protein VNI35_04180, partial [Nitrospira sp.]|nr:hypothetical protein [Nitrospira sp.]